MLIASKSKLWIVFCGDVVIIGFIKGDEHSVLYSHNIKIHNTYGSLWNTLSLLMCLEKLSQVPWSTRILWFVTHFTLSKCMEATKEKEKEKMREKITKGPIYDSSRSIYVCIKCRRHSMVNTRVCVPSSLSSHLKSRRVNVCIWHVFTTKESLNQSKLRKYFVFFPKRECFFDAWN